VIIERVAVIGAGTMGAGIAQVAALAGVSVRIADIDAAAVSNALARIRATLSDGVSRNKITADEAAAALARITAASNAYSAVDGVDLVIEAVVEALEVKRQVFASVDASTPATAILATNTSSMSVASIAAATSRPSRVVGMHFFNPVHVMQLVELVVHDSTDSSIVAVLRDFASAMKKTAIVVRDRPGFASSRLGVALGLEAMRMLEQGVATAADIDTAMTLGYGHPMGPLRVSDLIGLDVRLNIAEYLHRQLGAPHFEPPDILRRKVRDGELGKKTGKGFYDWTTNEPR
jgi:3-hydroxybutyryl-CoA dehydrogenase